MNVAKSVVGVIVHLGNRSSGCTQFGELDRLGISLYLESSLRLSVLAFNLPNY